MQLPDTEALTHGRVETADTFPTHYAASRVAACRVCALVRMSVNHHEGDICK